MKKNIFFIMIFALIGNCIYAQNNAQTGKVVTEKKVVIDKKIGKDNMNSSTTSGKSVENNNDVQSKQFTKNSNVVNADPTAPALEAFNKKYPEAVSPKWRSDKFGFRVQFFDNEVRNSAIFDNDGNWIETESNILFEETPQAVQSAYIKDFPGFAANKTLKVENPKDGTVYQFYISDVDNYTEAIYSAEGKIINKQAYMIKKQKSTNNK